MKIAILTNEYPPHVYGGAGVHVEYLVRHLTSTLDGDATIEVLCFGDHRQRSDRLRVTGITANFRPPSHDQPDGRFIDVLIRNAIMTGAVQSADVIHCHTWYTHLAGCLLKQITRARLVLTTHSLEPHRRWKQEQLGTAYNASSWVEKAAYENADGVIFISDWMGRSLRQVYAVPPEKIREIHNGLDVDEY